MKINYHLFKRYYKKPIGKKYFYWWYYYTDETGKRVQKPAGRQCTLKKDALSYIEELEEKDRIRNDLELSLKATPLAQFAENFFIPGKCKYLARREIKGQHLKAQTIYSYRNFLNRYIIPRFGFYPVGDITAVEVEDWLLEVKVSNSTRNTIIETFSIILREAKRNRLILSVPEFERFARNGKRKDTFNEEELAKLFPEDPVLLQQIWGRPSYRFEPEHAGIMFGAMFCLAVSAGLRPGEARAIHRYQIIREQGGIIIDKQLDSFEQYALPKKGKKSDPRHRIALVPEKTLRILDFWLPYAPEEGPIFTFHDRPVTRSYLSNRFHYGLKQAGINTDGRTITPHSLRYTYRTRMETLLPGEILRDFMGHRTEEMGFHYSRPHMLDRL